MTNEQKEKALNLRVKGVSVIKIAGELQISVNTLKSFFRRESQPINSCKQCGKPLKQFQGRKSKIYCNDNCRYEWWKNNRNLLNHKIQAVSKCANCGQNFQYYGKTKRKYCCHPCYISHRYYSAVPP